MLDKRVKTILLVLRNVVRGFATPCWLRSIIELLLPPTARNEYELLLLLVRSDDPVMNPLVPNLLRSV